MHALTARQSEVYEYILAYVEAHGFQPSVREIAEYLDVSTNGAYQHLIALNRKGVIVLNGQYRGMGINGVRFVRVIGD